MLKNRSTRGIRRSKEATCPAALNGLAADREHLGPPNKVTLIEICPIEQAAEAYARMMRATHTSALL
jgi:hypothetical protein